MISKQNVKRIGGRGASRAPTVFYILNFSGAFLFHSFSIYLFCYHVHSGQAWVQLEAFWDPRSEVLRLLAFHETTLSGQDCMVCSASSQKMIDLFENEKHFVRVRRPNDPRDFVFNCDHTGAVVLVKSEHGAISQHILNPQNPFCGTSELIYLFIYLVPKTRR